MDFKKIFKIIKIKKMNLPSNKQFGTVFSIFFFILAIYINISLKIFLLSVIFFTLSVLFLILGLTSSKLLNPLNIIWAKFGMLLSKIVSPIIMVLIYFFVVTPIGILMKFFKKELLKLKFNNNLTYWVEKNEPKSKMKNQF